jgi:hypothetical protein
MKRKSLAMVAVYATVTFFACAVAYAATTVKVVYPANMQDWQIAIIRPTSSPTPSVTFVNGPATPPLGTGSARLSVGADGSSAAELDQPDYAGTLLSNLTDLRYSTYTSNDTSPPAGNQTIFVILRVDADGDGTADHQLLFDPEYQHGYTSAVPDQGDNVLNTWQTWDARNGGWFGIDLNGNPVFASAGAGVQPLNNYIAAHPNAKIINYPTGFGGVRVIAGFTATAWDNFIGNMDALTIGVSGNVTTYDFEAAAPPNAGTVIISEFRPQGQNAEDEFVELYNNTDAAINLNGYKVVVNGITTTLGNISMPARGHYLLVNEHGYSLSSYAAGDMLYGATVGVVPDDAPFSVLNASGQVLDKVGFTTSPAGSCEGACLSRAIYGGAAQFSFTRFLTSGLPQDTDNNAADFVLVSPETANVLGSRLGAPGPENTQSPVNRGAQIKSSLFASCLPTMTSTTAPNRERNSSPYTDTLTPSSPTGTNNRYPNSTPNSSYASGTLRIRRRFTNNTGQDVTRLRFRVVDITAGSPGGGVADVRLLTSANETGVINPCGVITTKGLTVEQVPIQMYGGGLNTTVAAGSISTTFPLASGNSIDLNFLLGVQVPGNFRFFVIVEALPGPPVPPTASPASAPAINFDNTKGSAPAKAKSLHLPKGTAKGEQ